MRSMSRQPNSSTASGARNPAPAAPPLSPTMFMSNWSLYFQRAFHSSTKPGRGLHEKLTLPMMGPNWPARFT